MLGLSWNAKALDELDAPADYIGGNSPAAADRLIDQIEAYAERLTQFPYMHRTGRAAGTRGAVVHPNYIRVYRVGAEAIEILAILHSRQQYP